MKKPTIEEVKNQLKIINSNIEILDNEYTNKDAEIKCRCLIDGYIWYGRWGHLKKGVGCPKCAGKVITIKDIRKELEVINSNIKVLSDKYINSKEKLRFKCLICNNEWETLWGSIKQGCGCPKCGVLKAANKLKLTLEEIIEQLKTINPSIEILSDKYINSNKKLRCKCLICDYKWEASWNSLKQGRGCHKCAALSIGDKLRSSLDEIKEKLKMINPNVSIISDEYKNNLTKLKCKCRTCNYEWSTTWASLENGANCPKCSVKTRSEKRKFTLEEIKEKLLDINPNIEILSDKYINSKTKLHVKCLIDGNEWYTPWSELQQNYGCPKCAIAAISGENSYMWKGGISPIQNYLRSKITEWKKDSMKQCDYKCVITKKSFDEIHHIYSFDLIFKEVLQISKLPIYQEVNKYTKEELYLLESICIELHKKYGLGACLTKNIHEKFHELYGYGNNTPEQFKEFKKLQTNIN